MKLKQFIPYGISMLALLISAGVLITQKITQKKIAYVRSADLVYGYFGMKEAHNQFQQKETAWKANLDTLQKDYQLALSKYTTEVSDLSAAQKSEREALLRQQQQSIAAYSQSVNQKAQSEDQQITQAVLNQVNSFVQEYGAAEGYDIIFGTTQAGNLLYAEEAIDITDVVLEKLNKQYKGEEILLSDAN